MGELPKNWVVNRFISAACLLTAGLMADWHWFGGAFAWLAVSAGFLIWSISENEMRA